MLSVMIDNEILPRVQKPSRYLGTEINSVHKDPAEVDTRVCLCYPELYDLALGNLGLLILYGILNEQPGVWAERAYAPAPDLEAVLRERRTPLFSVESRTPLREFELLGFTLQYELTSTNLLNMLDLGGVPLLAEDRSRTDPLVVAGGPGAFNPAPLADFIDAFAVGDGEDLVLDLVTGLRETRGLPRDQRLAWMAEIPGMYVPSRPRDRVVRRVVADLDSAFVPVRYLVPFTAQVHDRVSVEVLRGCTHGCRFCQAGMVTRPVRERSLDTLTCVLAETLTQTGYEGVSLSSLNTCDHSRAKTLTAAALDIARRHGADVSLPSLRLDPFSIDMAERIGRLRKTGLTFAPEAASDRLRAVINKFLPDDELLNVTREVFARGWDLVKLYFMIGLPTEREEDVAAIADLTNRVLREGKQVNRRARVNLGVSTFVPKPHTPFQWERQLSIAETRDKQALLRRLLKKHVVKFGRHDAEMSFLEGVLSRADRSAGAAILQAYRLGCRLDGWTEHFSLERWRQAFDETGLDAEALLAARPLGSPLPWDFIDVLVDREWLVEEARRAQQGQWNPDCREGRCHECGVVRHVPKGCANMLTTFRRGRTAETSFAPPALPPVESPARWKLRFQFAKEGRLRWLSHLEVQNTLLRSLRRARIPVAYTQGFHPHPKLALAHALAVGVASEAEFADVVLTRRVNPRALLRRLNAKLPTGLRIIAAANIPLRQPALMAQTTAETYRVSVSVSREQLTETVDRLLAAAEFFVERWHKRGPQRVDIRPRIRRLLLTEDGELEFTLTAHDGKSARPDDILRALGLARESSTNLRKTKTEVLVGGRWTSPLDDRALLDRERTRTGSTKSRTTHEREPSRKGGGRRLERAGGAGKPNR